MAALEAELAGGQRSQHLLVGSGHARRHPEAREHRHHRIERCFGGMTVERFAAARHAFTAPAGTSGGIVDQALAERGASRRVMLQAAQFLVMPFIVASTDLVLTLPKGVAKLFQRRLPLVAFKPPLELEPFTISLIWHARSERDPLSSYLRRTLIEVAKRAARAR